MMVMLKNIITIIVISFIISVLIGCYFYKVIKDYFKDKVGRLEEKVKMLEERHFMFKEEFVKHMNRYH